MSVVPDRWSEPDSRPGTLYEIGWATLGGLVFGGIALFGEPVVDVESTGGELAVAAAVGAPLGVALVFVARESERATRLFDGFPRRFLALFAFIVAFQGLLQFYPTRTVPTAPAAALAAIPARVLVYVRHRE